MLLPVDNTGGHIVANVLYLQLVRAKERITFHSFEASMYVSQYYCVLRMIRTEEGNVLAVYSQLKW